MTANVPSCPRIPGYTNACSGYTGPTETMVAGRCANSPDRGPSLVRGTIMADDTCRVEGCTKRPHAKRLCSAHYGRFRRTGTFDLPKPDYVDRLLKRVERVQGCWVVAGDSDTHAAVMVDGQDLYAHRFAYEVFNGPIPSGYVIHHACEVRRCVHPGHLFAMSPADHNALHAWLEGFGFDACRVCGGTVWNYRPSGKRRCKACLAAYDRKRRRS